MDARHSSDRFFFFHEPSRAIRNFRAREARSFIRSELIGNFVAAVYRVALPKILRSPDGHFIAFPSENFNAA